MTAWKPKENYVSFDKPVCPNCGTQCNDEDHLDFLCSVKDDVKVKCTGCGVIYVSSVGDIRVVLINEVVKDSA